MLKVAVKRIRVSLFIGLLLAGSMNAQTSGQLRVELRSNHQIKIIAMGVTYGNILRALQENLGWEVEFPAMADEVKPSEINVEATDPPTLIRRLLEESHFGYAIQLASDSRPVKVVITAPATQPASTTADGNGLSPSIPSDNEAPSMSGIARLNKDSVLVTGQPNESDHHLPVSMPLSDAAKNMGVPRGVSPGDVGITNILPISGAAAVMGTSLGASSSDVGSSMAISLSRASEIIGNPPNVSPGDVGKTIVLPLGNGSSSSPRP